MVKKLLVILLLALVVRTIFLSQYPAGFHVDEVKVGWNAFSLLKTGLDDWGNFFPLHYNSFGDYRPTGFFYLSVVPIFILGLTEFSTRLTPAIFGGLTILPLFWFTYQLTLNKRTALLSTLVLALLPWHISLSRASSEGVISVCLVLLGLVYQQRSVSKPVFSNTLLSILFYLSSYLMYHPARLINPLLSLSLFLTSKKSVPHKNHLILLVLFLTTIVFSLLPSARGRFSQVSVLNLIPPTTPPPISVFDKSVESTKRILFSIPIFANQYLSYLNPQFYLTTWIAKPYRYATVNTGLVTYPEFLLFSIGLVLVIRSKFPTLPLILYAISILPAALTLEDSPNLHRSLFMIPLFTIIAAYGLTMILRRFRYLSKILIVIYLLSFIHFELNYFLTTPQNPQILSLRNYGTSQMIKSLPQYQKQYSYVLLTNYPDHLNPWFAFYFLPDVKQFNTASLHRNSQPWFWNSILFSHSKCPSQLLALYPNSLAIDHGGCEEPNLRHIFSVKNTDSNDIFSYWTTNIPTL